MASKIIFLSVGNADSIIICPEFNSNILVDIPKPRAVTNWLQKQKNQDIHSIYITHAHKDHFAGLEELVSFLRQWWKSIKLPISIILGIEVLKELVSELKTLEKTDSKSTKYKRLKDTWDEIVRLRDNQVNFLPKMRDLVPSFKEDNMSIQILHPEAVFEAERSTLSSDTKNEESLVLKVIYKKTSIILLADLEGKGLEICLKICSDEELNADIVKMPHHGSWDNRNNNLVKLLDKVNPTLSILSVGSKNKFRHVKEELFQELISRKKDSKFLMNNFICTEATRTCVNSKSERQKSGNKGLSSTVPCAGDITIEIDDNGNWEVLTSENHRLNINSLKYSACCGKADFH